MTRIKPQLCLTVFQFLGWYPQVSCIIHVFFSHSDFKIWMCKVDFLHI